MSEQIKIRDTRNGEWHWVYDALLADPHLTPADKLIYSAISTFSGCKEIYPTFMQMAERASLSERIAKKSVKRLVEVGYIEITKGGGRGKANTYLLLKMPKGCRICTVSKKVQTKTKKGANEGKKRVQNLHSNKTIQIDNNNTENFKNLDDYDQIMKNDRETRRLLVGANKSRRY